jgi:hypothetical protein
MSGKQRQQPADDKLDEIAFEAINREIDLLMKRLQAKGVCPCCVAQGMMYRGAILHADAVGPEDTVIGNILPREVPWDRNIPTKSSAVRDA